MFTRPATCAVLVASAAVAAPPSDRAKEFLRGEHVTVTWGEPGAVSAAAELEVGDGGGHGGTLRWLRFRPGKDNVEVLAVDLKEDRKAGRAGVTARRAELRPEAYVALVADVAVVGAAGVKAAGPVASDFTTSDVWYHARLADGAKVVVDLDWAGYLTSAAEVELARPRAAAALARGVADGLAFREHALTAADRAWVTAKAARDGKRYEGREAYWWVRARLARLSSAAGER